jgi:hypothetical protein
MLIADDILFFPFRSIFWIFKEIHNSALEETANEADAIKIELSELYMMLETGRITETQFDDREKELLDRLEIIQGQGTHFKGEDEDD